MNEEVKSQTLHNIHIEDEMRKSYMDYAMSVIVSRALPDVRDGLKPVHRRILYAMKDGGFDSTKPFRKSARIVGDVMGKYHPHGDQAIYDAMVRMAQNFSLRLPLIQGQGNFGSMDGDPPAAMRYTEARLAKSAETLLDDIDKETVDFIANYDESSHEPSVLSARFPNILVNGASGIAVGMATNIPPHNLGELLDGCFALIDNPETTEEELYEIIKGPDFPTGGIIFGKQSIFKPFSTGRGSIIMRGKTHIEKNAKDRESIIVTEVPYQVNKARMIERIAEAARDKVIEGISDLRDESDRQGIRVVIEVKRDAMAEVVLQQLFKHTQLQTSFGVNMLALNENVPELMSVSAMLKRFLVFRDEIVSKRTRYLLRKARARAHILAGLLIAIQHIDPVIELIRQAKDPQQAREELMEKNWPVGDVAPFINLIDDPSHPIIDGCYSLSEAQARAILELRLQRLTGLEQDKLQQETKDLAAEIEEFLHILSSYEYRQSLIRKELEEIKDSFATPRKTHIEEHGFEQDIEDLIQREDMVVTISHSSYAKRVSLSTYRAQKRGGKGRSGMSTKDQDFVSSIFVANTHTPLLFFSSNGMAYALKVYRLPEGHPQSKGKALVNILPLDKDERITTILPLPEKKEDWENMFVTFVTESGYARRNRLSDFQNVRANGKIAMKLNAGDHLVSVKLCNDGEDIFIASQNGAAIRFPIEKLRVFSGRNSIGVRAIDLKEEDKIVSMSIIKQAHHDSETRKTFLQVKRAKERLKNAEYASSDHDDALRDHDKVNNFDHVLLENMEENEQLIMTVSANGMGQLCSSYEYRTTNRGGKGIQNMDTQCAVVASYLVEKSAELMLVTDAGQLIRIPVQGIRTTSRSSKGIKIFNVSEGQKIISCALIRFSDDQNDQDKNEHIDDETITVDAEDAEDVQIDSSATKET